ncbi:nucleotide sugar dehydrogenase, partial [Methanosphaera sp.]|uniref:nucleotide sugar dehydrogenase n=1 Tax=Methanosphaera sp. TaxID=2666342 RepID=UPI002E775ABA
MIKEMFEDKKIIGVVGLGYVGLPLSTVFSKKYEVIGFDVDKSKIENYSKGIDVTNELEEDTLKNSNIKFSSNPQDLSKANFIIITVPTPIHKDESPDLSYVISATETVASNMKEGTIIVYESTVFPGATEEVCIPIIEEITGFECGKEFSVGYSPERINPGKNSKDVSDIVKIVSGYDEETTNIISEIYDSVLNNGIYRAPSIKVAEAAKITENIQRDVNIALMNELSIIFDKMDLDTNEIIDAAGTKWNF